MPLFSTPTQFAALGLLFIAGWLFGLASHPGGKKWKARYLAERDAHAAAKRDSDLRAVAAEKRAVEAEHENARLVKTVPVAPVVPVERRPVMAPVSHPSASYAARPAYVPDGTKRGWFDFNNRTTR
ncbi:MAG TPA: hypothetical protein VNJ10_11170 [Sphingomonas sp.]|nr:hypothetical protein [Sphingomonas sp.]